MSKFIYYLILLISFSCLSKQSRAQYSINFDYFISNINNDLANKFKPNPFGLKQVQTGGITAGCLVADPSSNFPIVGAELDTTINYYQADKINLSLFFQLDKTALASRPGAEISVRFGGSNAISFNFATDQSVGFRMKLNQDTIYFSSVKGFYDSVATALPLSIFENNIWYKLDLEIDKSPMGNSVLVSYSINNVGTTGTQAAQLIFSTLHDTLHNCEHFKTSADRFVFNSIQGNSIMERIDNLNISWHWPTRQKDQNDLIKSISIYPTIAQSILKINNAHNLQQLNGNILDYHGQLEMKLTDFNEHAEVDISKLSNGLYFINLFSKESYLGTKKFIKR